MRNSLTSDMLATDLANYLVRKGVTFREAHFICGSAVKLAAEKGLSLHELSMEDFKTLHSSFDNDVVDVWCYEKSVESHNTTGGTSRSSVKAQIGKLKSWLLADNF